MQPPANCCEFFQIFSISQTGSMCLWSEISKVIQNQLIYDPFNSQIQTHIFVEFSQNLNLDHFNWLKFLECEIKLKFKPFFYILLKSPHYRVIEDSYRLVLKGYLSLNISYFLYHHGGSIQGSVTISHQQIFSQNTHQQSGSDSTLNILS